MSGVFFNWIASGDFPCKCLKVMVTNGQENMPSFTFTREMTITYNDFIRILPRALGSNRFTVNDGQIHFAGDTWEMKILLSQEQQWCIGALRLPRIQVQIIIEGCKDTEAKSIMKRFDRSYQKGGG